MPIPHRLETGGITSPQKSGFVCYGATVKSLSVKIDDFLYEDLHAEAAKQNRSVADLVRKAIEQSLYKPPSVPTRNMGRTSVNHKAPVSHFRGCKCLVCQ